MEVFSTRGITPSRRLTEWNNRISERISAVDVDARHDFIGTMSTCQLGQVTIASIMGEATVLRTSADGLRRNRAVSRIGLSIQESQMARYRFGTREQLVSPMEFVLIDFASPFETETRNDGKSLITISMPASEILVHSPNAMNRLGSKGTASSGAGALLRSFAHQCLLYHQGSNEHVLSEMLTSLSLLVIDDLESDHDQHLTRNRVREEAMGLIDRFLCDPALNTHFLAEKLGVTLRYVQMIFADVGQSPSSFIRIRRLHKAKEAVCEADGRKISDIAYDVGFNDLSQFNRSFKARFGTSPSKLRRRVR